jgi:hypothetical protein
MKHKCECCGEEFDDSAEMVYIRSLGVEICMYCAEKDGIDWCTNWKIRRRNGGSGTPMKHKCECCGEEFNDLAEMVYSKSLGVAICVYCSEQNGIDEWCANRRKECRREFLENQACERGFKHSHENNI